jgi:hypothetical protein
LQYGFAEVNQFIFSPPMTSRNRFFFSPGFIYPWGNAAAPLCRESRTGFRKYATRHHRRFGAGLRLSWVAAVLRSNRIFRGVKFFPQKCFHQTRLPCSTISPIRLTSAPVRHVYRYAPYVPLSRPQKISRSPSPFSLFLFLEPGTGDGGIPHLVPFPYYLRKLR